MPYYFVRVGRRFFGLSKKLKCKEIQDDCSDYVKFPLVKTVDGDYMKTVFARSETEAIDKVIRMSDGRLK